MTDKHPSGLFGKFWYLLTPGQRRTGTMLVGLMLVSMMLEMLGIGLVVPALALLSQDNVATRFPMLRDLFRSMGNPSRERLAVLGMTVLAAVTAVRVAFSAMLAWVQSRFVYDTQVDLSHRLFTGYLRQPYAFHLQRNSAQLIVNVGSETTVFAQGALMSVLLILAEGLVLLGVCALLVRVEPVGTVVVGAVFGIAVWGFGRLTHARVARWGQDRMTFDEHRLQHLQQGIGGAKDVKLLGREDEFLAQYLESSRGSARSGRNWATLQQLPRLWLELLAVAGLAALVSVMIGRGKTLDAVLPALGLFAAAAFRLLPSVNRILGAVQNMRYSEAAIDTLYREVREIESVTKPMRGERLVFQHALTLEQVSYRYDSAHTDTLRAVRLDIPRGAAVGFIGSSGAGKSTLVDVILGLLTPTGGTVRVDGVDIQTNLRGWQDQIGYVPQSIFLTDDTIRRNVAFGVPNSQIDNEAVERALRAAQLDTFVHDLPLGLNTLVGERGVRLSGGQRQRIGIARALYHNPEVLVLDEATSSLDSPTEHEVMDAVRALKGDKTLLIVAHRLSTVEQCERLFVFERGRLVEEGTPTTILRGRAVPVSAPA